MSKVILVLDMPSRCWDCPCYMGYIDSDKCKVVMEDLHYKELSYSDVWNKRPDWCPLRKLPKKKQELYQLNRRDSSGEFETYGVSVDNLAIGYNQCIDDILNDE